MRIARIAYALALVTFGVLLGWAFADSAMGLCIVTILVLTGIVLAQISAIQRLREACKGRKEGAQ